MKRLIRLSMAASALTVILLLVSSMQSQSLKASSNENIKIEKSMRQERKKASDDANMQKSDKDLATRVIETGTKVTLHFGNTSAAKALLSKLPLHVNVSRYEFDLCGTMHPALPYKEDEKLYGWLNGDINFVPDGNWFTILIGHEEESEAYGEQVNLGKVGKATRL